MKNILFWENWFHLHFGLQWIVHWLVDYYSECQILCCVVGNKLAVVRKYPLFWLYKWYYYIIIIITIIIVSMYYTRLDTCNEFFINNFFFFSENFQRRHRWKQSDLASHCIVEQKHLEDFKVVKINDYIGMRIKL